MKTKLDKYLKEKLEIPQQPPADAWKNIQSQLPESKKNKRVLPFWLRLSGIAATLLLMLGLGYWLGIEQQSHLDSPGFAVQTENSSLENLGTIANHGIQKEEVLPKDENQKHQENIFNTSNNFSERINFLTVNNYSNQRTNDLYASNINLNQQEQNAAWSLNFPFSDLSWNNLNLNPTEILYTSEIKKNKNQNILLTSNQNSKEKKKKKIIDFNRFHLSAFASPLSFNTFVGSSMLSDEMSQYNTENSITLAYGIKGAYSLNPNLKLRTGISVVGLEQITEKVPLTVNVSGKYEVTGIDDINNIKYKGDIRIDNYNSYLNSLLEMELSGRMGYGNIQQQTRYIEIPLEAELSLFQTNSIGISATGGGSTWLLSKNKIYVHVDNYTQELGEASNLNKVAFSANAGLKFDLNLTDDVKLNVEPNFRYLINPVNNIEKYNPYTVGVNAGVTISIK